MSIHGGERAWLGFVGNTSGTDGARDARGAAPVAVEWDATSSTGVVERRSRRDRPTDVVKWAKCRFFFLKVLMFSGLLEEKEWDV